MNEDTMPGHATTPPAVKPKKETTGRPTDYTSELADIICERISLGESMRSIAKDKDMPAMSTLFKWLREHETFSEQYTRAKEDESPMVYADKITDIADATVLGKIDPNAARVAIDAYKWTAAKLKPKKYGDKLDHTSGGKELPAPILNVMITPNATNDIKREFIEAEVPEKRHLYEKSQKTNIMEDIKGE
jgi:hypothetical protein